MRIYSDTNTPDALANLLEAVAEPTRLRILNVLQLGRYCVCDLQEALDLSEPIVSRHLSRLRFAGLVTAERDGARMVYHLTPADSPTRAILGRFLVEVSKKEPSLQRDLERLRGLAHDAGSRRGASKETHDHHGSKELSR